MNILVTGSSGLIGSALVPFLRKEGHVAARLLRTKPSEEVAQQGFLPWDPEAGKLEIAGLHHMNAIVHLAGVNIAGSRWTAKHKARVRDSRVKSTRLLCETLTQLPTPRKLEVLVCASGSGYYGDRGDELLTEDSSPGKGFLAEVCGEWEAAAKPTAEKGIRVVHLRFGMVLSREGGALAKMLPPFRLGLGGKVGSGRQYWPWIALDDVLGIILYAIHNGSLRGPVNAVAPDAATNLEFTKALGRVLGRPTIFPMPAFAARLAFGEMADELLLSSQRLQPAKLLASGYAFQYPKLEDALQHVLGK